MLVLRTEYDVMAFCQAIYVLFEDFLKPLQKDRGAALEPEPAEEPNVADAPETQITKAPEPIVPEERLDAITELRAALCLWTSDVLDIFEALVKAYPGLQPDLRPFMSQLADRVQAAIQQWFPPPEELSEEPEPSKGSETGE